MHSLKRISGSRAVFPLPRPALARGSAGEPACRPSQTKATYVQGAIAALTVGRLKSRVTRALE